MDTLISLSPLAIASAFAAVLALALLVGGIFLLMRPGNVIRTGAGLAGVTVGAVLLLFAGAGVAWAGDTPRSIPIPPELVGMAVEYVSLGLLLGLGWLIRRGAAWLHLDRESKLVQRFEAGAAAALSYAREAMLARGADLADVKVRSELAALAGTYLGPKIPGVLRELKIDPAGLHERLIARLDVVAPHSAGITPAGPLRGA